MANQLSAMHLLDYSSMSVVLYNLMDITKQCTQ